MLSRHARSNARHNLRYFDREPPANARCRRPSSRGGINLKACTARSLVNRQKGCGNPAFPMSHRHPGNTSGAPVLMYSSSRLSCPRSVGRHLSLGQADTRMNKRRPFGDVICCTYLGTMVLFLLSIIKFRTTRTKHQGAWSDERQFHQTTAAMDKTCRL